MSNAYSQVSHNPQVVPQTYPNIRSKKSQKDSNTSFQKLGSRKLPQSYLTKISGKTKAPLKPDSIKQTKIKHVQSEITKFHVNSKIQLRYAITDVETQMQNTKGVKKEVFFDMYIPKDAFVSNFTMKIKGKTYQAAVKTKEVAKNIYDESTDTSGLLQTNSKPEFTDGKRVNTQRT